MSQHTTTPTANDPEQLKREIARTRSDMDRTLAELEDRVSPSRIKERQTEKVKGSFQRAKDAVMGATPDGDEVAGQARQAADRANGALQDATDAVHDAPQRLEAATRGNPLAAGLIAFGAGALLGSLLPASRVEEGFASELRDNFEEPVKEQLKQAGQEMKEDLQEQAQQAVEETRQSAQEAVEATTSEAQDAAAHVQDHAQSSAQRVSEQR